MTVKERKKAQGLLREVRRLEARGHSPLRGLTKAEILRRMRETRERLWEEKIAALGPGR